MFLVIEMPDFEDEDTMLRYLRNMQNESDWAVSEDPDDWTEGYGPMQLKTPDMATDARIVGILRTREVAGFSFHEIEPLGE